MNASEKPPGAASAMAEPELTSQSRSGIPVPTSVDASAVKPENIGQPGEYPFTRGIFPDGYQGRLWTIRQYSGFGTAEESNERYKFLLAQGQTGLSVALDLPTQCGYDPTHPMARPEIGKVGVSLSNLSEAEILFQGLDEVCNITHQILEIPQSELKAEILVLVGVAFDSWLNLLQLLLYLPYGIQVVLDGGQAFFLRQVGKKEETGQEVVFLPIEDNGLPEGLDEGLFPIARHGVDLAVGSAVLDFQAHGNKAVGFHFFQGRIDGAVAQAGEELEGDGEELFKFVSGHAFGQERA